MVAWHAFGAAAITYFVAAMPAMFFVTGSLLAKSLGRRGAGAVLFDRFRRLLVPLWLFAAVAWLLMAMAALWMGTDLPWRRALWWLLPFTDPQGTEWEGGWLSSHLWYLRTLVWLLLASPLLLRLVRALPAATMVAATAAVFGFDLVARSSRWPLAHDLTWALGDLALYGLFMMAGFLHRDGAFSRARARGWVALAVVAGLAAIAWRLTQPVPLGVVNNSHPLHLFVGAGWLALAMAAQRPLARLAESRLTGPAVRAIGRRALTIYLWHTAAIIVAVNVLEARSVDGPLAYPAGVVLLTALGTMVAVALFGWVEDAAAGRRSRAASPAAPGRAQRSSGLGPQVAVVALVLSAAGLVTVAGGAGEPGLAGEQRSARRPPIPSKPPPAPVFGQGGAPVAPKFESRFVAELDGLLRRWARETGGGASLLGVAIGPEVRWTGATGTRPTEGRLARPTDTIDLSSLTKLFTATLVHRLADAGLIDIAAPVPPLSALADFPHWEGITVEHLLNHSSGLVNYRDTAIYEADPDSVNNAVTAVEAALAEQRYAPPGAQHEYSSTNYLVLGLLLEDITGVPVSELFREGFFTPLQMTRTIHLAPGPGEPRGATSGIDTTLKDLLAAGVAILRDHAGMSEASYRYMIGVDPESGYGPGTFGFCPCRVDPDGTPRFFGVGYFGGTATLVYSPDLDMTFALEMVDRPPSADSYDPVTRLFEMVIELARRT